MNLGSRIVSIMIICFITSLTYGYSSTDVRLPNIQQGSLCARLYVNGKKIDSQVNFNTIMTASCRLVLSEHPTNVFLNSAGLLPVITAVITSDSTVTCPDNRPVPQTIILHLDVAYGQVMDSVRTYCCAAGFEMKMEMEWIPFPHC